ncbi:MAG: phosphatidylserine decarboxylase family protein [Betaproteobacteria bacterium]|nr:phosphatidylserine decarboxylase family protein [Betaproteobacteria bacterium]
MIAPEGRVYVGVSLAGAIVLYFTTIWLFVIGLVVFLFMLQFFRDFKREIKKDEKVYLSPADGKVVFAGPAPDPAQDGINSIKVSIFMNPFNVHVNRIPVDGKIAHLEHRKGKFLNASLDKASEENEANTIIIQTSDYRRITVVQVAGLVARRILCYVKPDQEVTQGQRYGFIRFGSRVDMYLPETSALNVKAGDLVQGGLDIIARRDEFS